jgi:hypothetical protein
LDIFLGLRRVPGDWNLAVGVPSIICIDVQPGLAAVFSFACASDVRATQWVGREEEEEHGGRDGWWWVRKKCVGKRDERIRE